MGSEYIPFRILLIYQTRETSKDILDVGIIGEKME